MSASLSALPLQEREREQGQFTGPLVFDRPPVEMPPRLPSRLLLLVFLCLAASNPAAVEHGNKETLKVALVYQNYAPSKVYDKAFRQALQAINTGQSVSQLRRVADQFELVGVECVLPKGVFAVRQAVQCLCDTILREEVSVVIFVSASELFDGTTSAAQYFLHLVSTTGIPTIAWNADNAGLVIDEDMRSMRMLQLAPPVQHQIQAIIALLSRYNWNRFGVFVAKVAGWREFIKAVEKEVAAATTKSRRFELVFRGAVDPSNASELNSQLVALKEAQAKIVVLHCVNTQVRQILGAASTLDLTSDKYLWIGTQSVRSTDRAVHSATQPGMLSVNFHTVSNAMFPPPDDVLTNVISVAPKIFASALTKLARGNVTLLKPSMKCGASRQPTGEGGGGAQVDEKWTDGELVYSGMLASYVKANPGHASDGRDSFFFHFDRSTGRLNTSLLTISNLRRSADKPGTFFWDEVGEFSAGRLRMADVEWPGGRPNPPAATVDRFHVKVVTLHEPPFVTVSELDADTQACPGQQGSVCDWGEQEYVDADGARKNRTLFKCCSGYCIDLLNKLANDIGFTYTLYKVRDEKWGLKTEHGWNGLIHDLVSGQADICVTSLKVNSERAKDIDFSLPFLETGISIVVKIRSGVLSPTAFLEPFEYSTWLIILFVSIQLAALAIFLFEWISPYSFNMQRYPPPDHKFSLCRTYWLVWATLFAASVSTDVPRSTVARFMALVWAAFGLTFLAVYTANLAAFMITRVQFYDLSGVRDPLLTDAENQRPPFRFGTVWGGNTHETMKSNWADLHEYVKRYNLFTPNVSAGVDAVKAGNWDAFIYDAVVLDYWAAKDANCELMMVGKWSSMTGYAVGLARNSPYTNRINQLMLHYQQNGDLERLQNFWLTGACGSGRGGASGGGSEPLGIENFTSAFFLLVIGIIISMVVLGGEHIYVRHLRGVLQRIDPNGWCGIISMTMGKSLLTFSETVDRVREWRTRAASLDLQPSGRSRRSSSTTMLKKVVLASMHSPSTSDIAHGRNTPEDDDQSDDGQQGPVIEVEYGTRETAC